MEVADRFCRGCGAPLEAAPSGSEVRKTVSVVFCDLVGSTSLGEGLDPEALRVLLARYFERMKAIVERDGGTVEKFIGDAVMAVFGVPLLHEDDAVRACRAALEMHDALPELGLVGRIGITSGEVVTGTDERLVTGDPVNVASRLEEAAEPGQVLVDSATVQLADEAVEVARVEPLRLKGKAEPVPAFRLLGVHEPERRHEARFVGRRDELALVREAWERARSEERCELVTVVGEAGIGKSRLVAEALPGLDARVVQGRCLPFGEGITYWPVVEVIKQLDSLPSGSAPAASIRALLGETEAATTTEEIAWAFRKLLEEQAPLVVVFDDLHWGEETFLDLVESISLLSSGAPLLLLCLARPELLAKRSEWPVALRLEPLPDEQVTELIGDRLPETVRERIAHAAGGNPLFLVEMLAMAAGSTELDVPPTLRALLAARLDQLDPPERRLLERAAVEGEIFHHGALQALTPEEPQLTHHLATLTRRELIRPDKSRIPGEDGFRFRHLLIRDTAYDAIPKSTRAELHQHYAAWLQEHATALVEHDQLLGYHLEQTCRYRRELGQSVDAEIAAQARERLTAAGRRAFLHADVVAAAGLLDRAITVGDPESVPTALEADLLDALFLGMKVPEAFARLAEFLEAAEAAGDELRALTLRVIQGRWEILVEPEAANEKLEPFLAEAMPLFEAAEDDLGLAVAWLASYLIATGRALMDDAVEAGERSIEHARRAGLPHRAANVLPFVGLTRVMGSTGASELLAWADKQQQGRDYAPMLLSIRAWPLAWLGRADEAREVVARSLAGFPEGAGHSLTTTIAFAGEIELQLGNPAAAAEHLERACSDWEQMGERGVRSTFQARLAEAQYELGRLDEAERNVRLAEQLGASDDVVTQMAWQVVEAKLQARRGDHAEAERLAREAVAILDRAQMLNEQAGAYAALGEVLALAGKTDAAREALEQALERYERKENLVSAERARARLAELREDS